MDIKRFGIRPRVDVLQIELVYVASQELVVVIHLHPLDLLDLVFYQGVARLLEGIYYGHVGVNELDFAVLGRDHAL